MSGEDRKAEEVRQHSVRLGGNGAVSLHYEPPQHGSQKWIAETWGKGRHRYNVRGTTPADALDRLLRFVAKAK